MQCTIKQLLVSLLYLIWKMFLFFFFVRVVDMHLNYFKIQPVIGDHNTDSLVKKKRYWNLRSALPSCPSFGLASTQKCACSLCWVHHKSTNCSGFQALTINLKYFYDTALLFLTQTFISSGYFRFFAALFCSEGLFNHSKREPWTCSLVFSRSCELNELRHIIDGITSCNVHWECSFCLFQIEA